MRPGQPVLSRSERPVFPADLFLSEHFLLQARLLRKQAYPALFPERFPPVRWSAVFLWERWFPEPLFPGLPSSAPALLTLTGCSFWIPFRLSDSKEPDLRL